MNDKEIIQILQGMLDGMNINLNHVNACYNEKELELYNNRRKALSESINKLKGEKLNENI